MSHDDEPRSFLLNPKHCTVILDYCEAILAGNIEVEDEYMEVVVSLIETLREGSGFYEAHPEMRPKLN